MGLQLGRRITRAYQIVTGRVLSTMVKQFAVGWVQRIMLNQNWDV
jgi:hypothetical protein